jgi:hypothetical protein
MSSLELPKPDGAPVRVDARVRFIVRRLPADVAFSVSDQTDQRPRGRIVIPLVLALCGLLALVVGVGVLVGSFQTSSAEVEEFSAAPRCPAPVDCRPTVPATVLRTYSTNSKYSTVHVVVRSADGSELDLRAPKGAPAQLATPGHPVTLTYWRGDVAEVSDPAGQTMQTDDHPAWRGENRRWAVVVFGMVGLLGLAAAASLARGRRRRSQKRYRLVLR